MIPIQEAKMNKQKIGLKLELAQEQEEPKQPTLLELAERQVMYTFDTWKAYHAIPQSQQYLVNFFQTLFIDGYKHRQFASHLDISLKKSVEVFKKLAEYIIKKIYTRGIESLATYKDKQ